MPTVGSKLVAADVLAIATVLVLSFPGASHGEVSVARARGAGVWHNDAGGWRELVPGDECANLAPIRVGPGGSAEILLGRSRFVLGPGTRATPRGRNARPSAVRLDRGLLRAEVAAGDGPLIVELPVGRVELGRGETVVSSEHDGATVHVIRGRAEVSLDTERARSTHTVHTGEAIRMTEGAIRTSEVKESVGSPLELQEAEEAERHALGRLVLRDTLGRETDPLEIRELRVRVRVLGAVALTEIEQTFFNPTDRRAEGVFYFPVPAGASPSRFAMYVEGSLVEGELVERVRAREVYEEIVRRMQDPALMEWQEGNIFKTRIFPIPPRGPKRILISYTQVLRAVDGQRRYVCPLVSKTTQAAKIGRFEFDVELSGLSEGPISLPTYPDARIERNGDTAHVQLARQDFQPVHDFVLRFAPKRRGALELATDRRAGEDGFFMLSYAPPADGILSAQKRDGRDVVFLVDTSLSRGADDYKAQLMAARTLLSELGPHDRFAVISFDVAPRMHHEGFVAGADEAKAALSALGEIVPLGATDMEATFKALDSFLDKSAPRGRPEVILLGDGISTLGETAPERLVSKVAPILEKHGARFHAVAMGARHDRLVLEELARRTGGLFRVMSPGDDIGKEAFRLALALDSALLPAPDLQFSGGEVCEVYPDQAGTLVAGEEVTVLGRYKSAGTLNVTVRREGTAEHSQTFELPETDSRNVFIPRLWARERLDALLLFPQTQETRKEVIDLSQEFTLITPYTSFLVLENEEAYRKYGIDRRKRRRYWEEMGKLRTAPPPEELKAARPRAKRQEEAARPARARKSPPPTPSPCTLADLDLALILCPSNGREVATALATLCLETYYRYLPIYRDNVALGPREKVTRVPVAAAGLAPEASTGERVEVSGPLVARDIFKNPKEVPAKELVEHPVIVHEPVEISDHFETDNDMDQRTARGHEDAISDIPLGGTGVWAYLGVGGGGAGTFGYRYGGGRRRAVKRFGGSSASESALERGLRWLARHQRLDGRWGTPGYEETGLALLAFLGAGYTRQVGKFRDTVASGLDWLTALQDAGGQIAPGAYEHAVGTLALCEAYGMTRVKRTGETAQQAIDRLIALQELYSGWGEADGARHPLVTVWAVAALKSGKVAGLQVQGSGFQGAINYLDEITARDGAVGTTGRPKGNEVHLMHTAGAMLARMFMGWDRQDPLARGPADLLAHLAVGTNEMPSDGLYLRYFGTLGMFMMGGEYWREWNAWSRDTLVGTQCIGGDRDGSWNPGGIWIRGRTPLPAAKLSAEETAARIADALVELRASPRTWKAYESLAAALAATTNVELLQTTLQHMASAPADARAMVRARLGSIHLRKERCGEAVSEFSAAYETAGRPENVLALYVYALRQEKRAREALVILLAEANEGRTSPWRRHMTAELLFDPASEVEDPVAFVNERLTGKHIELKAALGMAAGEKLPREGPTFLKQAYDESGRDGRYTALYVGSLRAAGRAREALDLLVREAREDGRTAAWRIRAAAQILLSDLAYGEAVVRYADEALARHPKVRAALKLELTRTAKAAGDFPLLARLYEDAFHAGGRRADLVQPYVDSLMKAGRNGKAACELESAIKAGYHTRWAFETLASTYGKLGRGTGEGLRAASSEVEIFPRDVQPRVRLANHYARFGLGDSALEQYREAARIRPEDPHLHRQVVERAAEFGRFDAARMALSEMFERWSGGGAAWGQDDRDLLGLFERHPELVRGDVAHQLKRRIRRRFEKDLVVVMSWDTQDTDVDLHVTEPGGQECCHRQMRTSSGGALDHDDTDGLGPETYSIRRAKPGRYRIDAVYYNGTPRTKATIRICRNRHGEDEAVTTHKVELTKTKERVTAATVEILRAE